MDQLGVKKERLLKHIKRLGSLAVGFSGGVDSTLLVAAARQVLGDRVLALTAESPTHPRKELANATALARTLGVRHVCIQTDEMQDPDFISNGPERCYYCKRRLFAAMRRVAQQEGIDHLAHGANVDDLSDYRPGNKAAEELGVLAPLNLAGLTKADIRQLAKQMGLPNWDRPAMACLATRIPYGDTIGAGTLEQIDRAERRVLKAGATYCRVRHHGNLARIEIYPDDMERLMQPDVRHDLIQDLKTIGYQYVCMDMEGYISGKMNREL